MTPLGISSRDLSSSDPDKDSSNTSVFWLIVSTPFLKDISQSTSQAPVSNLVRAFLSPPNSFNTWIYSTIPFSYIFNTYPWIFMNIYDFRLPLLQIYIANNILWYFRNKKQWTKTIPSVNNRGRYFIHPSSMFGKKVHEFYRF